ncbi:MAG: hypothetical protein KDG50_08330 [Chromatiales bacterium]|nr:hypothetical protein [Chromatiales bacterium]
MPLLTILTNVDLPAERRQDIADEASKLVAELLGKPESYVMIALSHNPDMRFAGSNDALAYLELKSIDLPQQDTTRLSDELCTFIENRMDVDPSRVYIEFADAERHMWGWSNATF